ncbi:hypothetical protein FQN57_003129 [Myotisia sp. PD_48]|nr:hypothetical protein FQN57_003129 [Myotisia sp. PD_48]
MEKRHEGHDAGMSMGNMSLGGGIPSLFQMQRRYWAVVGTVFAIAVLQNLLHKLIAIQRFSDKSRTPAKPKSLFFSGYATITALSREFSYASLRPWKLGKLELYPVPLGRLSLILANLVVLMVFCFYKLNSLDQWSWENIGYRTGFMTIAQLPLVFLLAGKNNIIGFLLGTSYERLNWFHRWISRTLWLTSTVHMGFWFRSWGRYNYIIEKLTTDPITQRGFAAWCILTFILITSFAPVRRWSYELFFISHILTFSGFLAAVWYHANKEVKNWVWVSIGLLVFDRLARWVCMAWTNLSFLHPSRNHHQENKSLPWANHATFTPLAGNVTKVTIPNPVFSWKPGQHVFLAIPSILPFQSHPFTIASIPSDNKLEFFVRAERGGTRKLFEHASQQPPSLGDTRALSRTAMIDGPYGAIRPLAQFDSVLFFAGGMGATFTIPLLRDIVAGWKSKHFPNPDMEGATNNRLTSRIPLTKRLRFVWAIRSQSCLSWFNDDIETLLNDVETLNRAYPALEKRLEISIYVTCDPDLSSKPTIPVKSLPSNDKAPTLLLSVKKELSTPMAEKTEEEISVIPQQTIAPGTKDSLNGCLPGGGCCCTTKITDENAPSKPCTCSSSPPSIPPPSTTVTSTIIPAPTPQPQQKQQPLDNKEVQISSTPSEKRPISTSSNSSASTSSLKPPPVATQFRLLSGRPDIHNILRAVLEKAEGESGVVVCGPQCFNSDVRRSVVSLSDERAVHKGTGAQGIYLHTEQFGF